jgi:Holliday junction DNA helicase RuvB
MGTAEDQVYDATLGALSSAEGLEQLLWEIVEYEKTHPPNTQYEGWEWHDVHGDPRTLNGLVTKRVLSVTLKTNKCTMYKLTDREATEKALKDYQGMFREEKEEEEKIPPDLFDIIIGHEDKKDIIKRGLMSEKPVHILLWGTPASAKSLILEELSRLPRSHFILGSSLTKAGIYEVLFNERPKYLLLDELDKIDDPSNLTALLSLMERGLITETKSRRHRQIRLKTWVMASANRMEKIPVELLSRFVRLRFSDYTENEFMEVAVNVLRDREGVNEPLALYIGQAVLRELRSKDVRDAVKISRLLTGDKSRAEVDHIIGILRKQT